MSINKLKHKYLDKDCVVLTCGPSLTEYDRDKISDFCKDKIVICIKDAVLEFEDICDIFVFNRWRVRDYGIKNKNILSICQSNPGHPTCPGKNKADILIPHDRDFKKQCLLKTHNFELNNFDNKISRTWGPGILLETVFYLCLHAGIKTCYTIGWDLTDPKELGTIRHYFDHSEEDKYSNSINTLDKNYREEMRLYHDNVIHAYNYFKNKGMDIIICGENSFIDKNIPRIHL